MKKVLYSNYNLFSDVMINDAKLNLRDMCGIAIRDITEAQIEEYIYDQDRFYFHELMGELDAVSSKRYCDYCAIGTAQTWRGRRLAMTDNCYDYISDCVRAVAKDCDYVELWLERGNLHIKATHHDGTHYMVIKGINLVKERAAKKHVDFGMRFYDWLVDYSKRPSNYLVAIGREVAEQFGY